jgi:hypothetical protein
LDLTGGDKDIGLDMGANITIYCLEKVTDYFQFERMCHDLMAKVGYSRIEPLGGFSDKGRDAIHISRLGDTTIFAYSVREDWRAKLSEDANKIKKHNHNCDSLAFVTTADVSASERDEAAATIKQQYGWELELFHIERLRNLLDVQYPEIKRLHESIFPPSFLALDTAAKVGEPEHIFISYMSSDKPLGDWLAKKLASEGYSVWCEHLDYLGSQPFPPNIEEALRKHVAAIISIYSPSSIADPESVRHRVIAQELERTRTSAVLVPIDAGAPLAKLDRQSMSLVFIPFQESWLPALVSVIKRLERMKCPKPIVNGRELATRTFIHKNTITKQTETVISNNLAIKRLPETIKLFTSDREIPKEIVGPLVPKWSFRRIDDTKFLSFHAPPSTLAEGLEFEEVDSFVWNQEENIHGIKVTSLVSELIRKAMIVKFNQKGLRYCRDSKLNYFPYSLLKGNWLHYTKLDGSRARLLAVGQRTLRRANKSEKYNYYLAPVFTVRQQLFQPFTMLVSLRIRFATTGGTPLVKRSALTRRKHLTSDWWNDDWLNRLLAVTQYLADDEDITIGSQDHEEIIISSHFTQFSVPTGINDSNVDINAVDRSAFLYSDDSDDDSDQDENDSEEESTND